MNYLTYIQNIHIFAFVVAHLNISDGEVIFMTSQIIDQAMEEVKSDDQIKNDETVKTFIAQKIETFKCRATLNSETNIYNTQKRFLESFRCALSIVCSLRDFQNNIFQLPQLYSLSSIIRILEDSETSFHGYKIGGSGNNRPPVKKGLQNISRIERTSHILDTISLHLKTARLQEFSFLPRPQISRLMRRLRKKIMHKPKGIMTEEWSVIAKLEVLNELRVRDWPENVVSQVSQLYGLHSSTEYFMNVVEYPS